jgi:pimeloyl-ACP methyl ester carboxylesterase
MKSHFIDVSGPTHYVEQGSGTPLVLVHGIGASYLSWQPVIEALATRHRVMAIDLIGFGFTPPHGRKATVQRNARLVTDFIETVTLEPVTLVGNSMGGLVAMLAAVAEPELIERLILVNPALPIVSLRSIHRESQRLALPLLPILGPLAARYYYHGRSPEQEVDETLNLVLSSTENVDPFYRAASVEMSRARREMEWAIPSFTEAARSIAPLLASQHRFRRILHRIAAPTLLVHGDHDAVVPPASARWAAAERPDWDFVMLANIGHTPQVQDPERFVATVATWLDQPVLV